MKLFDRSPRYTNPVYLFDNSGDFQEIFENVAKIRWKPREVGWLPAKRPLISHHPLIVILEFYIPGFGAQTGRGAFRVSHPFSRRADARAAPGRFKPKFLLTPSLNGFCSNSDFF